MRESVRNLRYVVTTHAEEELYQDCLTVLDIENAILTGAIQERQKDWDTGEWKYVVVGTSYESDPIGVVGKWSSTGYLVTITVHRA